MRRTRSRWAVAFWAIAAIYAVMGTVLLVWQSPPSQVAADISPAMFYLDFLWTDIARNAFPVAMLLGVGIVIDMLDRVLKDRAQPKL